MALSYQYLSLETVCWPSLSPIAWKIDIDHVVATNEPYSLFAGFIHLAAGLACGFTGLAAGYAIGIVGDAVSGALAL